MFFCQQVLVHAVMSQDVLVNYRCILEPDVLLSAGSSIGTVLSQDALSQL